MWHHLHLHIFKYKTPTVSDLWPDQQRLLFVAIFQLHTEGQLATKLCTLCRLITKHLFHQPNASDIPSNVAVWLFIIWLALETDTCTNKINLYPVYPHSSTFLKFINKIRAESKSTFQSSSRTCQSLGPVRLYSWWWRLQCHIRCNLRKPRPSAMKNPPTERHGYGYGCYQDAHDSNGSILSSTQMVEIHQVPE